MNYKEIYLKNKIEDLTNRYKIVATLSIMSFFKGDYANIRKKYDELQNIHNELLNIVEKLCRPEYLLAVKDFDLDILPDYFKPINTIKEYQNILALQYANVSIKDETDYIQLNKMSIALNPKEELPYLNIIKILFIHKKYPEIIKICNYLAQDSISASVYGFLGDAYTKTKQYGKALKAYNQYSAINEYDKDIEKRVKKLYKEILK